MPLSSSFFIHSGMLPPASVKAKRIKLLSSIIREIYQRNRKCKIIFPVLSNNLAVSHWQVKPFVLYLINRMEFADINKFTDKDLLGAGKLLIAQPFLADNTFSRSVIFLCEHSDEGALGFLLNQPTNVNINDVLPEFPAPELPINHGGPVQLDTLHIIHRSPGVLGGTEVKNGIFWGASLDGLQLFLNSDAYNAAALRLYVGYSGWSPGQLEDELKEGSWLVTDTSADMIFDTDPENVWRSAIYSLGRKYRYLAGLPVDPNLN